MVHTPVHPSPPLDFIPRASQDLERWWVWSQDTVPDSHLHPQAPPFPPLWDNRMVATWALGAALGRSHTLLGFQVWNHALVLESWAPGPPHLFSAEIAAREALRESACGWGQSRCHLCQHAVSREWGGPGWGLGTGPAGLEHRSRLHRCFLHAQRHHQRGHRGGSWAQTAGGTVHPEWGQWGMGRASSGFPRHRSSGAEPGFTGGHSGKEWGLLVPGQHVALGDLRAGWTFICWWLLGRLRTPHVRRAETLLPNPGNSYFEDPSFFLYLSSLTSKCPSRKAPCECCQVSHHCLKYIIYIYLKR